MTQLYMIVLLVKWSRKYALGSHDYANTAELVFIIGASLNLRRPLPRGWELGDPVKTEGRTSGHADNFICGGPRTCDLTTCDTSNLERTDAHGGATGPINSPNELHLVFFERF